MALVPLEGGSKRTPFDVLDDAKRMDPYRVLGVPFLSSKEEVRQAYVRLCRKEHPDLHGGQESMEWVMGEWAYRVLMDPQDRAEYDTARVVRNALSLTEGVFAFGFAAATRFGSFLVDALHNLERASQDFMEGARKLDRSVSGADSRLPVQSATSAASTPATGKSAPAEEKVSLMDDINSLRDDITKLREDIRLLSEDTSNARRLADLEEERLAMASAPQSAS